MDVFVLGSYIHANSLMVNRLPVPGESLEAVALYSEHGGKGLNMAVGMHRLGLQVETLLMIGNDVPGRALLQFLQAEGMDASQVVLADDNSGFGVGLVSAAEGNIIAIYPGANAQMETAHIQANTERITNCRMVCAQFEIPDMPILEAFQLARQYGILTLLAPSPWRVPHPALLPLVDILVLNETEAMALLGIQCKQRLAVTDWLQHLSTLDWQGKLLVVTLADYGCVALQAGGGLLYHPAWVVTTQDPTGAGDAFTAGLAFALLTDYPLATALHFANACGAWVAASTGVVARLPTLRQVEKLMQDAEPISSRQVLTTL